MNVTLRHELDAMGGAFGVTFRDASTLVALVGSGSLWAWSLDEAVPRPRHVWHRRGPVGVRLALSRCGRWVGEARRSAARLWDLEGGAHVDVEGSDFVRRVDVGPGRLALSIDRGRIELIDAGGVRTYTSVPEQAWPWIAFRADGTPVLGWNVARRAKIRTQDELFDVPACLSDLAVHPDGHYIAAACDDSVVRIWDARPRPLALALGEPFIPYADVGASKLAFGAGYLAALYRGELLLLDVVRHQELARVATDEGLLAVAPDGVHIAVLTPSKLRIFGVSR